MGDGSIFIGAGNSFSMGGDGCIINGGPGVAEGHGDSPGGRRRRLSAATGTAVAAGAPSSVAAAAARWDDAKEARCSMACGGHGSGAVQQYRADQRIII